MFNSLLVRFEDAHRLTADWVPKTDRPVTLTRGPVPAIRVEGQCTTLVSLQREQVFVAEAVQVAAFPAAQVRRAALAIEQVQHTLNLPIVPCLIGQVGMGR